MLNRGITQPFSSPWAPPTVVVQKKDRSPKFCVDYHKLNAITQRDVYSCLLKIDDTLDTLSVSQWFSTFSLISGYWQVEVLDKDRQKTTYQSLFEFKVILFGLSNAPATFQRLMYLLLAGLQWSKCLIYLNDIILLGKNLMITYINLALCWAG